MNISIGINPLLEVLIMLDRLQRGCDVGHTNEFVGKKYGTDVAEKINELSKPLIEIQSKVIEGLDIQSEKMNYLFGRTGVLSPKNPIGCSPASMILANEIFEGSTSIIDVEAKLKELSIEEKLKHIMATICMESTNETTSNAAGLQDFLEYVKELSVSSEQKWRIIDTLMNFDCYAMELCSIFKNAEKILMDSVDLANDLIRESTSWLEKADDMKEKVEQAVHFITDDSDENVVCPCLFAPECAITIRYNGDGKKRSMIYIGVMMSIMQSMPTSEFDSLELVEKTKVLADRSRLDILAYIKNKPAYGQEIADEFNLYSTTISHHMSRLVGSGFVFSSSKGTKSIYSLDRESIGEFLDKLRHFLLD